MRSWIVVTSGQGRKRGPLVIGREEEVKTILARQARQHDLIPPPGQSLTDDPDFYVREPEVGGRGVLVTVQDEAVLWMRCCRVGEKVAQIPANTGHCATLQFTDIDADFHDEVSPRGSSEQRQLRLLTYRSHLTCCTYIC